jgi:SpoVK/Ycf46/Vps4 family AAA+-type ATPase
MGAARRNLAASGSSSHDAAAAMLTCADCATANRDSARYCKRCGTIFAGPSNDTLLGSLVGLDEIGAALREFQSTVEGMRRNKRQVPLPFNTLILGNSGTAKSLIGSIVTTMLFNLGVVKSATPVMLDAMVPDALTPKDIESSFDGAKGGVLFVDNVHKLVSPDGTPNSLFNRLIKLISSSPVDPIVVLAGLPFGLQQFLGKQENKSLTSRFQNIFRIDDYPPAQLTEIACHQLTSEGFAVSAETRAKLELRFRRLYKQAKKGDPAITAYNGHMALREAGAITRAYYKRQATDQILLPDDIRGPVERRKPIDEILRELDAFIGMAALKKEVRDLYAEIVHARSLAERGLGGDRGFGYHFTITGNPGTGKTTVARALGEIFEALGVLPSGHVLEVDKGKMVIGYIGQTAPNVHALCDQAMGGILFIDEAYTLAQKTGVADFGQEAIETLLKRMEDDRGKFVVIAAGYPKEISDFLKANPGLQSRFTKHFHLEDYTPDELTAIFELIAKSQGFGVDAGAHAAVVAFFKDRCARKTREFANGREARTLLETALRSQSERVVNSTAAVDPTALMTISAADIPVVGAAGTESLAGAMRRLDDLVGLAGVKKAIANLRYTLEGQKLVGENEVLARHFVFSGNPGTGKTTVARILADIFFGLGLLPTNRLVEVDRSQIVMGFKDQTPANVNLLCDQALGGVLFIDEAYTLKQTAGSGDASGQEAIDTLLKRMEDDRGKFVVIAAGYTTEMHNFLESNPGLRSRFSDFIEFEDYGAVEMASIFAAMARGKQLTYGERFDAALLSHLQRAYAQRTKNFANARFVRQLFDQTRQNCSARVMSMKAAQDIARAEIRILRPQDLGEAVDLAATRLDQAMRSLDALTGLASVKDAVARLRDSLDGQKLRNDNKPLARHFIFTGNPGTGKTTVARILADIFFGLGLLPSAKLIEADRSKMVAPFAGQTAPMVEALCDQAMGGVLFIDEAYTLHRNDSDPQGLEAIDILLKRMEDDRGKFVVIVAGYAAEMHTFLDSNPGLRSRFTTTLNFEDYQPADMAKIFAGMAKSEGLQFAEDFPAALQAYLERLYARRDKSFGNAREVRQVLDRVCERCAGRVAKLPKADPDRATEIRTLRAVDLGDAGGSPPPSLDVAMQKLDVLVGLDGVKRTVKRLKNTLEAQQLTGDREILARHFIFTGNPGTGKTTVARILADIFAGIGMLPTNKLIEADRSKMIGSYQGHTAQKVQEICDRAMGGILFVDEAYALKQGAQDNFGQEAVDTLLKRMEDDRGKFTVIAAGYSREMDAFLDSNSGLRSRFSDVIDFEDYNSGDMIRIFSAMAKSKGVHYEDDFAAALRQRMELLQVQRSANFANARTVRQIFEKTQENCAARVADLKDAPEIRIAELRQFRIQDLDQSVRG